ncbi:MAG TPA: CDP-diacylglycerol--glycerol-3-phosphate 3-phosphatidyltransferase [Geothrix sp.]|uniref:CDP-diacylglycerol--glycerol-3-phosphate 3-phosphatidyltransferase n=1 Tax=Geothrix mesophila TaxID=2922723 RepID=UPI001FADAE4C|nr:CDP-diacylglycerol--glycerol-3-phosphate 3-phosphatidyltransferase [Geothrix sp. SG198]HJV39169.1 CDP-diacylglycerol--glycerol-3-phosphate 3-phosphatidyltransferase [Geothrix sp.]
MPTTSPLTLPNALTLLRILAIPFFAIAVWYGHHWQAFIIFGAAGLTDLLDGLIARAFDQGSDLGAVLDPAADKLLMTTAFVLLAWRTQGMTAPIPVWVAMLAITRDLVISFYAFASVDRLSDSKFHPSLLGKVSTAAQLVAVSLGLLFNALGYRRWMDPFLPEMYWVVAALVLASGIHYFVRATRTAAAG